MKTNNSSGFIQISISLALAMCLRILPLPESFVAFNPDWVLLTLIYWSLTLPERAGIFHAWTIGLVTDVLTGRLLGLYALAYALVIYLCINLHKRLRNFPMLQQGLFIYFCLLLSQLLLFFIKNIQHPAQLHVTFWLPVFTGTLVWPIVYGVLRLVRLPQRFR